ncbi:MAG: HisA/HisF-related TIM barrel protein [Gammaproteobacteria bacterium]
MLLIPAIQIKNGKCLIVAGKPTRGNTHTDDPVEMAKHWVAAGARRLHIADLDSVVSGKADNAEVIRNVVNAYPGVPMQVSGGMRSDETVEKYFAAGAEFVILNARAASAPHFINDLCLEYPGHILVALEAKAGKVAAEGWSKLAQHTLLEAAENFQREGVSGILCSVRIEGTSGSDFGAALSLAQVITIPVMAVDGLASLEDVRTLCKSGGGLSGAVLDAGFTDAMPDFAKARKLADALAE